MVVKEVKKEATGKRPSVLSEWYRRRLGRDVAISDIDWVITSISNKDIANRYLIIEEKTISTSEQLLIGLGQARSLKEVKKDIVKASIPILVIFVENHDMSQGVWLYEFNEKNIDDKSNWCQVGQSWYVDVKKYSNNYTEEELIKILLSKIGSKLR